MWVHQPDLFWPIIPIFTRALNINDLSLLNEKRKLESTYDADSVYFLWIEKIDDGYVAKVEFQTPKNHSKMRRLYFQFLDDGKIHYTGFSFGTNTHREPKEWTSYSYDNKKIYTILREIVEWDFISQNNVQWIVSRVKSKSRTLFMWDFDQLCPLCKEKSSNGYNCSSCWAYDVSGLTGVSSWRSDIEAVVDRQVEKNIRVVRWLKFLPNESSVENGELFFRNVYINGSSRKKIKVTRSWSKTITIYINPQNWTRVYVSDKQKFWQLVGAVNEIIHESELAE